MYRGILKYLSILILLFGIWNLLLGYFPFLLFLLFVLLFFLSLGLSYKSMKTTDISINCDYQIIERDHHFYATFLRQDNSLVQCGQIIIEYEINNSLGQVICHQRVFLHGEETMERFQMKHCGAYQIRILKVYCFDILNCLYIKKQIPQVYSFYVFPKLIQVDTQLDDTIGYSQESNEYSPYQKGDDYSEPFEIRPYHENDLLKHIHWKASMKKDELFVKVGSQPIMKKLLLAVELHQSHEDDRALDYFYSLCLMLLKKQVAFEILCPQAHSDLPLPELMTHQEQLHDCIKRLLKEMKCDYRYALSKSEDYLSVYVITHQGIEVYGQ